jgi:HEAT repeat protein
MPLKSAGVPAAPPELAERAQPRDVPVMSAQLDDPDPQTRRWAARDLAGATDAVEAIAARLAVEPAPEVREALLDALRATGDGRAVDALIGFLRSDDAGLRIGAVGVLQELAGPVGPRMRAMLADPDADVRIMAVDVLRTLAHPEAPAWLAELLDHERHVNVVGAALDRLAEIGDETALPALDGVRRRFGAEPYIVFAADTAIRRIAGGGRA